MFAIANGRKSLWQWDLNQQLTVAGSCTEVHYLDKGSPSTLTVAVKDGKADIPNILLQKAGRLIVYAYIIDAQDHHTKVCETFGIAPRPKPAEYVYTETEVKTWSNLQSQIGDLADLATEEKDNLVDAINEVNSIRPDWNQNDETAADYVKNRICYKEEIPEQHVVLCENVHVNNVSQINDLANISEHLQVGTTYTVDVDGYTSTATAYDANANGVGLNLSNSSGGIGMIFEPNSSGKISWSGRPNLSFTFSISRYQQAHTVYHKIDSNYLSSEIFWAKITQDDDGNVTSDKTPDEIAAAYEAGRAVYAKYTDIDKAGILSLSFTSAPYTIFTGTVVALGPPFRALVMYTNGAWSAQFSPLGNVVTELSNSSTDNEVPSAKCVYDLVGNITAQIDAM